MLLKVWVLTLVFGNTGYNNTLTGVTSQKYIYTTSAQCDAWRKFWTPRTHVASAQCTQEYVLVPK